MDNNKTIVLITGANGGIGYNIAEALLATTSSTTYHILLCSRSIPKGETALAELKSASPQSPHSISLLQLEVTDEKSITAAVFTVQNDFGRVDVLINNAGIVSRATPLINNLRDTFETNTFGPAVITEAFAPLFLKSSKAQLIYVSSGLGSISDRTNPYSKYYKAPHMTYRMCKAALNMCMVCYYAEFKDKGVKAWAWDPDYTVTNLTGEEGRKERIKNGGRDPRDSVRSVVDIMEGKRDRDVGKFVNSEGVYDW